MILVSWYTKGVFGCDSDSGSYFSPDYLDSYDQGLCCWYSTVKELVLDAVVVVELDEDVDILVDTRMVVETGPLRHMDMDKMVE